MEKEQHSAGPVDCQVSGHYHGFTCPNCGGYKWGTSNCNDDKSKWIGHCHGGNGFTSCGFTWHRATDDEKMLGLSLFAHGSNGTSFIGDGRKPANV